MPRVNDSICKDAFRKFDPRGRGFVHKSKLDKLLLQLSVQPTRTMICEMLGELDHEDGLSFEAFRRWYRRMLMPGKGSNNHPLLLRSKQRIGRAKTPHYDLPPELHVFGKARCSAPGAAADTAGRALDWTGIDADGDRGSGSTRPSSNPRSAIASASAGANARPSSRSRHRRNDGVGSAMATDFAAAPVSSSSRYCPVTKAAMPLGRPDEKESDRSVGINHIIERLRKSLKRNGINGTFSLQRFVRLADANGDGKIDLKEFTRSMQTLSMDLSVREVRLLFEYFDRDCSGDIDLNEFRRGICGDMGDRRRALVKKAFAKLDADGSGTIEVDDIRGTMDASHHPAVLSGIKSEDEVLAGMLNIFESVSGAGDGTVTSAEFLDYYQGVSMAIDNDDHFELLVRTAWNLEGGSGAAAFKAADAHDDMGTANANDDMLVAQMEQAKRRAEGFDQIKGARRTLQRSLHEQRKQQERRKQSDKRRYRQWAAQA